MSLTMDIDGFLARSGAGESSLKLYRYNLEQCEAWMGKPLGKATERDLTRLKSKLRTLASGRQYANLLRMFYKRAKRDDLRELCVIKQRAKRMAPEEILTLPEVQTLINHADTMRDKAILACLWETGARVHEIMALNLGDVKEKVKPENGGRIFVLWFGKAKVRGEEHSGYVMEAAPPLATWLNAHPDRRPDAPLFTTWGGGRLGPDGARRMVYRVMRRAKIGKRVYPHLFRHSRATHLLRMGVPGEQVKQLLGWKPNSIMLARYSHLVDRDAYAALLKASGYKVEEADLGKLSFTEEELRAVVPMATPPPREPAADAGEVSELIKDPKVARFVALLQEIASR